MFLATAGLYEEAVREPYQPYVPVYLCPTPAIPPCARVLSTSRALTFVCPSPFLSDRSFPSRPPSLPVPLLRQE